MAENIVLLHGFLGSPSEFSLLVEHLDAKKIFLPDLYEPGPLDPTHSFVSWVDNFKAWLSDKEKPWVIGYSMGGRLALHVAALAPECVRGVVAISAHPGIDESDEQARRAQWEAQWIEIFQNNPMPVAIQKWQSQEVFAHSERAVVDVHLDCDLVVASMRNWSTACHVFAPQSLWNASCPLFWVVGQRDTKYLELLRSFLQGRPLDLTVIERAAHRVHLDAPKVLAQVLNQLEVCQLKRRHSTHS